jgi:hypothetical protein
MKPILKSYLIEVNVGTTQPGNGTQIFIQDYSQLRNVYLTGITTIDQTNLLVSPSGKPVFVSLTGTTLTLVNDKNQEIIYQYPAFDLNPLYQSGFYRDIVPFKLQLTKSFITIVDNALINANDSLLLNMFYFEEKDAIKYLKLYGNR